MVAELVWEIKPYFNLINQYCAFESLFNLKEKAATALCLIAVLAYPQMHEQILKFQVKFRIIFVEYLM